jgi:hypothetical protein
MPNQLPVQYQCLCRLSVISVQTVGFLFTENEESIIRNQNLIFVVSADSLAYYFNKYSEKKECSCSDADIFQLQPSVFSAGSFAPGVHVQVGTPGTWYQILVLH